MLEPQAIEKSKIPCHFNVFILGLVIGPLASASHVELSQMNEKSNRGIVC